MMPKAERNELVTTAFHAHMLRGSVVTRSSYTVRVFQANVEARKRGGWRIECRYKIVNGVVGFSDWRMTIVE